MRISFPGNHSPIDSAINYRPQGAEVRAGFNASLGDLGPPSTIPQMVNAILYAIGAESSHGGSAAGANGSMPGLPYNWSSQVGNGGHHATSCADGVVAKEAQRYGHLTF